MVSARRWYSNIATIKVYCEAQRYCGNMLTASKPISEVMQYDLIINTKLQVVLPRWPSISFKTMKLITNNELLDQSYFSDR